MGWNSVVFTRETKITAGFDAQPRFYFVHGYAVKCVNPEDVFCECQYGTAITAGIMREHLLTQEILSANATLVY